MAVTIRDVAKHADVSVATVSRALRGHSSVSVATRERVERSASELNYTLPFRSEVHTTRRNLRVAVVLPYIGRWYFSRILEGVESVLGDREGDLLVVRPFDRQGRRRNLLDLLEPGDVDAAILVSLAVSEEEVTGLRERKIGLSLLGTSHPLVPHVRIDDIATSKAQTDYLISLGHTRIGHVTVSDFASILTAVNSDRRKGFIEALDAAGIEHDEALEVSTDFSIRGAQNAVEKLFSLSNPPTAIVAESDELAFGVIVAARSHGLRVPEDLSVIGIDDHDESEAWNLTTVAQPVSSLGEIAAWQAISRSEAPGAVVMPTSIIVRGTTMALKVGE